MEWVKSKTTMIFGICLAVMGLQGYATMSMRKTMEERLTSLEDEYAAADERITMLSSDLGVVTKRTGVTAQELQQAQGMAIQLKRDNARLSHRLRTGLAAKADSKAVATFQNEATTRLNAVQQEAKTNFDGISGDVRLVRTDLDATRSDLKATRVDLNATREDVANSKRELGTLIARNSTELSELRRRGERDYLEFDVRKSKQYKRVGDVLIQLKKTDVKRHKYEVVINADDSAIQKKDRTANEPVTFLVGPDRVRYELVVNNVDKDRIRGYISAPKDTFSGAQAPVLRVH